MKSTLICAILIMIFQVPAIYAMNYKEIEYHCPSFNDIKYERGQFSAVTNYNGIQMTWYSLNTFPEAHVPIVEFRFTNGINDCIGGTCEIYCVYTVQSGNDMLKLFVSRQEYRFVAGINGPWKNEMCDSTKPEDCTFSVVKDSWW